jgi:arsenite-transporting ATPase
LRVLLFTGKGGVGKTTLAAATATAMTATGHKTLVVSTDQAHSLGDVLDVAIGAEPTEAAGGLYAAQIDTRALVDRTWTGLRQHLRTIMAASGVGDLAAEELTTLPGVEELLALFEVAELARNGPWETVLVDCAPTAETLRLLALPEAVAGYVERLFPAHRRMVRGMLAGLAGHRSTVESWDAAADALSRLVERAGALRELLADRRTTAVRLVLTPERVVLAETRRILTALALLGIRVDGLLVNRLIPAPPPLSAGSRSEPAPLSAGSGAESESAPLPSTGSEPALRWLRARRAEQDDVLASLSGMGLAVRTIVYRDAEPVGLAALRSLGRDLADSVDPVDLAGSVDLAGPVGSVGLAGPVDSPGELSGRPGDPASVRRVSGSGRSLDAEFELSIALPLDASTPVDLARIGDELAVTVDGRRRLIELPSVLRRCTVTGAERGSSGLRVLFRPDPALWMR